MKQEKRVQMPIKLPLSIRRKLERMAESEHSNMTAVIVRLINEAPDNTTANQQRTQKE